MNIEQGGMKDVLNELSFSVIPSLFMIPCSKFGVHDSKIYYLCHPLLKGGC